MPTTLPSESSTIAQPRSKQPNLFPKLRLQPSSFRLQGAISLQLAVGAARESKLSDRVRVIRFATNVTLGVGLIKPTNLGELPSVFLLCVCVMCDVLWWWWRARVCICIARAGICVWCLCRWHLPASLEKPDSIVPLLPILKTRRDQVSADVVGTAGSGLGTTDFWDHNSLAFAP